MSSASSKKNPQKKPVNPKKKKIIAIVAVCVMVAVVIGVIAAVVLTTWEENQQRAADRKIVATCNGYEIPYEELRFLTLLYKDTLEDEYGEGIWDDPATAEQYREELEKMVQENLNEHYVILTTCRNLQIPTESREMDKYVANEVKKVRKELEYEGKEYEEWLAEMGMTDHYFRFSIGVSYLESVIYYALLDNDLYAFRQDNIEEFKDYVANSGNYVHTVHVFIENAEGEDPAANLARAKEISDHLRSISDFESRRYQMNEYIGSKDNDDFYSISGEGHYFTRGEMDEAYENASFDLEIGDVSEPVVCSGGNFIIMRLEPNPDYITKNAQTLLNYYHSVALGMYEDQFRPDCVVTFNEYGQSIDLVAMQ